VPQKDRIVTEEEAQNVKLCEGIRDAINEFDLSIIDRVMASDFADHHPGLGDRVSDRETYKQALKYVHETLDMKAEVEFSLASGPFVITRVRLTGRHIGAFANIEPTQNDVVWSTIEIYRAEGGQLKERWALDDLAGLLKQLGLDLPI
jgi:predicted ester cyclase